MEVEQLVSSSSSSSSTSHYSSSRSPSSDHAAADVEDTRSNDEEDDVVDLDPGVSYKPLTIELDAERVRLRGREGKVKSEQTYGANTWLKPIGRRYFVVCVGPPNGGSELRYCRAPSREARDLLVATFRAFAGGTGAFYSQALGAARPRPQPRPRRTMAMTVSSRCTVERDIRELKAALATQRAAAAAGMKAVGDAFTGKSERLLSSSSSSASVSASASSSATLVLRALANTYLELAALTRVIPVSAFFR